MSLSSFKSIDKFFDQALPFGIVFSPVSVCFGLIFSLIQWLCTCLIFVTKLECFHIVLIIGALYLASLALRDCILIPCQ